MSDTMTNGVVDAPATVGGATATETPEVSPGTESVASENGEQAGASQDGSDGGSVNGSGARQRGKSVYSQMRELQSRLREQRSYWESEVGGLKQQLQEIRNQFTQGPQTQKPGKLFWDAPGEVLTESLLPHLAELKKELKAEFEQTQTQREEHALRGQEISEAAKFIRSQKGLTEDDVQDIREILLSNPNLSNLPPMDQAEFALYKWQKTRGITDNSAKKERASTVTGAPPQASGPKIWTESEIQAEIAKFPPNVAHWTKEQEAKWKQLDDEFKRAYREKRVTK